MNIRFHYTERKPPATRKIVLRCPNGHESVWLTRRTQSGRRVYWNGSEWVEKRVCVECSK